MAHDCSAKAARRYVGGAGIFLGFLLLSGCGPDRYPEDLKYPVRTDPIVTKEGQNQPQGFDKPGDFPRYLEDANHSLYQELNKEKGLVLYPQKLKSKQIDQIGSTLETLFGTPRHPVVEGIKPATREALRLDKDTLARGSTLYRLHCLHCHGLSGDGRGPTASWVNPHPRDYRQGIFKFISTDNSDAAIQKAEQQYPDSAPFQRRPRRADLKRILRQGVEGTSMPSFGLLPDDELDALVSYVIHLSLRGQTEYMVMQGLLTEGAEVGKIPVFMRKAVKQVAGQWQASDAMPLKPEPYPYKGDEGKEIHPADVADPENDPQGEQIRASVQRGQKIFKDETQGNCLSCHFDYGRTSAYKFDPWGTIVRPANLTSGVYRGGRRPIDLYWRIAGGIENEMARLGPPPGGETPAARSRRIWDLVNFLDVLPYPKMREKYGIKLKD
jgi:mono/diheme cytochrome c family protein